MQNSDRCRVQLPESITSNVYLFQFARFGYLYSACGRISY